MKRKNAPFVALFFFSLLILALNVRCQYDYASPLPGLIDIHSHPSTEPGFRGLREDHGVPEQQMTGLHERSQESVVAGVAAGSGDDSQSYS